MAAQKSTIISIPKPDFQWFEPVTNLDLADMKPKKRAHSGWFATYDRLNLYGSRPDTDYPQALDTKIDSGSFILPPLFRTTRFERDQ